jgi:hypothetical protein
VSNLTINFLGIAVHMTQMSPYRVIIPAGPVPNSPYGVAPSISIPNATALGCLPPSFPAGTFWLTGVTFTVGSGGTPLQNDLTCIPHLSELPPSVRLDEEVVRNRKPPAAAYFDLLGGQVLLNEKSAQSGSAYGALTVDLGDVAELQMTCWNDGSTHRILVPLPATINVSNIPAPAPLQLDAREYLANFLVAEPLSPLDADLRVLEIDIALDIMSICLAGQTPRSKTVGAAPMETDTFPSCSNSQWP